jgi:hypothetical protein
MTALTEPENHLHGISRENVAQTTGFSWSNDTNLLDSCPAAIFVEDCNELAKPFRSQLSGLVETSTSWSEEDVESLGLRTTDASVVSIGGGLASFALVDQLRIRGMDPLRIRVIGATSIPWAGLASLIFRLGYQSLGWLRSDSATRIDNPWGFPSYAMEQAWQSHKIQPLIKVLCEPFFFDSWTPDIDTICRGLARECHRIAWDQMLEHSIALGIKPRKEGGWWILSTPIFSSENSCPRESSLADNVIAVRASALHLGIGHGKPLPPWQDLGLKSVPANAMLFNPYLEPRMFELLQSLRKSSLVAILGSGTAALQVTEQILTNAKMRHWKVLHLAAERGSDLFLKASPWEWQPFASPRSAFGGPLHHRLALMPPDEQKTLIKTLRLPTAPYRRNTIRLIQEATSEGRYEEGWLIEICENLGELRIIHRSSDGIKESQPSALICCTGLRSPSDSLLVGDLSRIVKEIEVDDAFGVVGLPRKNPLYITGALAGNGPIGPVDSFWGLLWGAWRIGENLAERGLTPIFGTRASLRGWWRWIKGEVP